LIVFLLSFSVLQKDIKNLINETNQLGQSNDSLNKELTNVMLITSHIIAERDSLINRIHADTLTGFDINTIKTNGYDTNYIMWLSADSPLTLESVTIKSDKPGRITIRLHSPDDKIICTKDIDINKKEATISAVLNFTIPKKGDYYLSFTSINNVNLCYTTTNGKYVFPNTGCLKITGGSPNDNDTQVSHPSFNFISTGFFSLEG
jgi:hypothetical protein